MYNVFDLYCDTDSFNRVAGNYDNLNLKSLNNQLELIKEEFNELIKGHEEGNLEEIVDGCADVAVTLFDNAPPTSNKSLTLGIGTPDG